MKLNFTIRFFCSDLDDEIVGISNLDSVQVMKCVAECLSRILSEPNDLEYLPKVNSISESMNMSVRYKYATQLSTSIQVRQFVYYIKIKFNKIYQKGFRI